MKREVLAVSELTDRIAKTLETTYPEVSVRGEISSLTRHSSGHWYFNLKDRRSTLRAVMFKFQNRLLPFIPNEGEEVVCRGRVTVYAPRGAYQLQVDWMEPQGVGALHLKFEQLKLKLEREGLFDPGRKRAIPSPLKSVAIITSLSGAALQDMLRVLGERDPGIEVLIVPSLVQGGGAAESLARALETVNRPEVRLAPARRPLEAVIVGRGGGSLEDLWAFNEEVLARAIHASTLPVISAVGHEIDFTIADFTADHRAPTPTAAAELVSAGRPERIAALGHLQSRLLTALYHDLDGAEDLVEDFAERLPDPRRTILESMMRLDELVDRGRRALVNSLAAHGRTLDHHRSALRAQDPRRQNRLQAERLRALTERLERAARAGLDRQERDLTALQTGLTALSPKGALERGYAIVRDRQGRVVREAGRTAVGQELEVLLRQGRLGVTVDEIISGEDS